MVESCANQDLGFDPDPTLFAAVTRAWSRGSRSGVHGTHFA
jgi:hypothetical protein